MRVLRPLVSCVVGLVAAGTSLAGDLTPRVDFNRQIRPILSENCFQCHGPDRGKRKGDLRLDTKEGALASVIVPEKPDESELCARITSHDDDERMPPKPARPLSQTQIALLKRWIEEGAEWKAHWAYIPPVRPAPPDAAKPGFDRNDVDRFILAKLQEKGLASSPEADRLTLIRRLSFDLTGLPPTPAEVDAFIADRAPDAYEKLVDRFLASPHFGERLAAYWLDLVRYADTTGIHGDNHRDVYLYRDYVIDAFNENRPFDQFTTEQLAGDLLPNASDRQKIASGYNRMLMTTQEGGAQAKEYLAKYAADRVRNASTVWLGATLGCAECHDHKFDPFKTRDFYRFAAFFADLKEVAVGEQEYERIPSGSQKAELARLDARRTEVKTTLATQTPALDAAQAKWESSLKSKQTVWTVLRPLESSATNGTTLDVAKDGAILAKGANPESDTYALTFKLESSRLTGLRLEVLPDATLPSSGPGRASNGNFVLNEMTTSLADQPIRWSSVSATHSQDGFDISAVADSSLGTGWAILPQAGKPTEAVFESAEDLKPARGALLRVVLAQNYGGQHTIGRFRISATDAPRPLRAGPNDGLPKAVSEILALAPAKRADQQKADLSSYYRGIAPELSALRKTLVELEKQRKALVESMPRTLVSTAVEPRTMRILPRGNWLDDSGPVVTPAVPAFLSKGPEPGRQASRLDLARWLVARDNPLVARVFVNRLWKLAFGQGIVATLDDFGSQGAWPTHPDLLDWLATDFVDRGWNVKQTLRLLVTSGTYRQSSRVNESLRQIDPYNHWLARQGRYRLEAEEVRDNALAISGLLSPRVGGPSAKPYQPPGYWFHLNFPKREYQPDHGEGLYRRGLYTYWCRTFLHPSLLAFDAPTREECKVERTRSNTPLQALVLMDDPTYVEAARVFAEHVIQESDPSDDSRLRSVYRLAVSRTPRPSEVALLTQLLKKHRGEYRADANAAQALIHTGERPVPADIDPTELAAWTSVARVILNLYETNARN